jgi:hypothetical protein
MAGTSDIEVANKAVILMGSGRELTSLSDDDDAARALNTVWDLSRRAVLRAHFWNFAQARITINADPTPPPFEWAARFRLPGDFLNLRRFYPREIPWDKEGDYLLTDEGDSVSIVYTKDEANLGAWDAMAIDVFAAKLAHDVAYRVTGSREVRKEMGNVYKELLRGARHMDAMEGESTRTLDIDVFERSRFYGSSRY